LGVKPSSVALAVTLNGGAAPQWERRAPEATGLVVAVIGRRRR
jgi:hypothetical protein